MFDVMDHWYRRDLSLFSKCMLPFSFIFRGIVSARFFLYRIGFLKSYGVNIPVVVVGNLTIGGTGKTPLVIWLADWFKEQGYTPGIVTRGYSGKRHRKPYWVNTDTSPQFVGDEALLLARHTGCPVVVSIDRVRAVKALLDQSYCDIVITDDGLQHYRLKRTFEIAVVDGSRRFGNARLLPAGPLREPLKRLDRVNLVVVNGSHAADAVTMDLIPKAFISVQSGEFCELTRFAGQKVHAVAGIGHPERFFKMLEETGLDIIPHTFRDHYSFSRKDIDFGDGLPVIMTEKDAVKCSAFASPHHWYLALHVKVSDTLQQSLLSQFSSKHGVRNNRKEEERVHEYQITT